MVNLFLIIIYLAFISLGLPDSLLGSAWPSMRLDLGQQLGAAGMVSMTISVGTIISSLNSGRMITRFGTGKLTLISCFMTASALLGFALAPSFWFLILFAIPLGLGAGSVDSALNHYVAEHYQAHHMNWLHSFWGVGATTGPLIMAFFLSNYNSWRGGYTAVSSIQFVLVLILFITLPTWKKIASLHVPKEIHEGATASAANQNQSVFKIKGVKYTLLTFLLYCGIESMVGLWGASYLVGSREMTREAAAGWIALYYGGITLGRMVTGFITMKIDNRHLILYGQLLALIGAICVLLPLPLLFAKIGLVAIGLGLAPIFPGLIHETPKRFGSANATKLIGYQMATAYTGITFLPPLFGLAATFIGIGWFPFIALIIIILMLISSERVIAVLS